jgi:hypothetical protein|tara:strand:+ start:887 stop:1078 length:192 start_codon:yes stop_codon:yes gene_type:complete
MNNNLMTFAQVYAEFDISPMTLWRWRKHRGLTTYGVGGKKYVKRDELLALIQPAPETATDEQS